MSLQAASTGAARPHDFVWSALALIGGAFVLAAGNAEAVQFEALQTLQGGIGFTTVLELGPEDPNPASNADGCIYAVNGGQGAVSRVCFDANKNVTSNNVVIDLNGGGGTNNTLGITIDPDSDPAGEIHLYLGYSDNNSSPFAGKIARAVSTNGGASYTVEEDFITGLGRSSFDHQTNGLDFGPDGCLYISQGNNSNAGYDSAYAANRFTGAVLRSCFKNGSGGVDPSYDRDCGNFDTQEACDVEIYASGLRNPYDIVWHSNGFLYNTDNDANPGFRDSCPNVANTFGCPCQEPQVSPIGDEINLIEQDKYYGSPNPYMANPSGLQLNGSQDGGDSCSPAGGNCQDLSALCTNPTLCDQDVQCLYFGHGQAGPTPAQDPNNLYRAPLDQTVSSTLDGITIYEPRYTRPSMGGFCSDWDGSLIVTAGPGAVRRYSLSANGLSATHQGTGNLNGANGLDVVTGPDGTIYIATLNGGSVQYLKPIAQPNPGAANYFASCAPGLQCVNNACQVLTPCTIDADCDDGNACTQDTCNTGNGLCTNNPTPLNGTSCDDGVACTIDTCQSGLCTGADNCPVGQICNPVSDVCEVPVTDVDNDGLFNLDPCPTDALNTCFGPVAVDGNTGNDIRINANVSGAGCSGTKVDCNGDTWLADFGFNQSGSASSTSSAISGINSIFGCSNAATEDIFQCEHWDPGSAPELIYNFAVPNGDYVVNLLFANTFSGTASPGSRLVDITIEGNLEYDDFDQFVASGGDLTAVVRASVVTVTDGDLEIEFGHVVENPALKGIEVLAFGGPPPECAVDGDCDDGIQCTIDTCDGQLQCVNDAAAADGLDCDDGIFCTFQDMCSGGDCQPGIPDPQQCDDADICTNDICDLVQDCINTPNTGNNCDDGNACTTTDLCSAGSCVGSGSPNCNDGEPCTNDSCNPSTGCVNAPNSNPCDDGLACTSGDTCTGGQCVGADNCPAGQACQLSGVCGPGGADNDNDGFSPPIDCNDNDNTVFPGAAELCDGKDNDCDGPVDEGNPGGGAGCSTGQPGVCSAGTTQCSGGSLICEPDTPASAETCNGLDDDCDGSVDEGNPQGGGSCSTGQPGVCAAGTQQCQSGSLACVADNSPSAENCNGLDDDCDGSTDEGNPGGGGSCATGQPGECAAGTQQCQSGSLSCVADSTPTAEVCDGLDNDCDGSTDEGNPGGGGTCSTGQPGACATGTEQCTSGALECVADNPGTEICDGIDNDCDGSVDEGNPGGGGSCGVSDVGACQLGTETCSGGTITCAGNVDPTTETCDGVDNDCDGSVDEGNPGGGGSCGVSNVGACQLGTETCSGGAITCAGNVDPTTETCDGVDNDCDGSTDEGNPGGGATCGVSDVGACQLGTETCSGGAITCVGNIDPTAETCDGLDNNCDGSTDEGTSGASCNTGLLGVCGDGTEECISGTPQCIGTGAIPEICDGLDNDCDGQTDEGNPGGGNACSTGQQGICDAGTEICQVGTLTCVANATPGTETCNGLDDDCDGTVDDGNPGGGAACTTGATGQCSEGTETCTGGAIACVPDIIPEPEICNGIDDNCDGQIDEGNPGGGGVCSSGLLGVCEQGSNQCVDGSIVCVADLTPSDELCGSGEDEDCDGAVDEPEDCLLCLPQNTVTLPGQTRRNVIKLISTPNRDKVIAKGTFLQPTPALSQPDEEEFIFRLTDEVGVFYEGTLPVGSFLEKSNGRKFFYKDRTKPYEQSGLRQAKFSTKSDLITTKYTIKAQELELSAFNGPGSMVTIKIGETCYVDTLDTCTPSSSGKAVKCQ